MTEYDAIVVGAGPNGLAAAVTIARRGHSVLVLEANDDVGGGARTAEFTDPGFRHDVGSAVHPLGVASPFFSSLPLADFGLEWIQPAAALAHPLDGGRAVVTENSLDATVVGLGHDGPNYRRTYQPIIDIWRDLAGEVLEPALRIPRHPRALARFGLAGVWPATTFARRRFSTPEAQALFAGHAAHSILPLSKPFTASFGLLLATLAHVDGWPIPRGGAQAISNALAAYFESMGGMIETGHRVKSLADLPPARAILLSVTPRQFLALAGDRTPPMYARRLRRFRYGPGAYKVDYALAGPVPWADPAVARAATVHIGGSLEEIAVAEREVARGGHPHRPFLITAQPSLFDPTRAPNGKHTFWAYTHVPNGSTVEMAERIESQIERFAPGFRERIIARFVTPPAGLEAQNANLVGGDIGSGAHSGLQLLMRPTISADPYVTPIDGVYLCGASTPPGGGVHGMCGHNAALSALRRSLQ